MNWGNSKEKSPSWEATSDSDSQEKTSPFIETEVSFRVRMRSPPDLILSQMSPIHALISYFFKIHFSIIS
jgi:hypothetical protein